MGNPCQFLRVAGLLLLVLALFSVSSARCLIEDDVRSDLAKAYESVAKAEAAGGSVAGMVSQLDDVARKLPGAESGSLEMYKAMVDAVQSEAVYAEAAGRESGANRLIVVALVVAVVVVLGVVVWVRGSRWFWGAWLRVHRGWRVERV